MSRRNGPKDLAGRRRETIDAARRKIRETVASPFLAWRAGVVRRRLVRALSLRKGQAGDGAAHAQCRRVLCRADQPPVFPAQPLLLTSLAFPGQNGLEFSAISRPTYFLPHGGTDGPRHGQAS